MAAKLNDQLRKRIVCDLAAFATPSEVADLVRQEAGVDVSRQSIEAYDPTTRAGRNLTTKWRVLFEEARAAFLRETSSIGISHRAVRLRRLEALYRAAADKGDLVVAAELLEQAAREVGDCFKGRRHIPAAPETYRPRSLAEFYADVANGKEPVCGTTGRKLSDFYN
ncbi:MAG: DUF2280 domain-containing protein [Hyphomicrobiales bacterium]|nr:MAG: DUF2280 domain-containing protein [Hyphomicrobiales bacterium]